MLGMKNHFDISGSIEIREVDIAGVACISIQFYSSKTLRGNKNHILLTAFFLKSVWIKGSGIPYE